MTKSKWQRWFAAPIMAALLLTSFAPAVMAAPPAVITQAEKVSEVTGTLAGGQFAKIWLGLKPENPGTVTVTSVWDRSDVDAAGLGFFILDPEQLTAVYSGGRLTANNIAAGSQGFFLNGPTNTQGASFRATGPDYSIVVYNDSPGDASFVLKVTNAFITDEGDQVKPVGAMAEATEAAPAAEAAPVAAARSCCSCG